MSEPQIAHRCPSCGASIRVRALFCPHCGETLPEFQTDSANGPSDQVPDKKGRIGKLKGGRSEGSSSEEVKSVSAEPASEAPRNQGRPGPRETVNRARVAARDLSEEDRFQGVEKLRHISSVVLDEAAYDPSLRFVLVAAVLFVLFLVLLVASEMIT
ncbi:MAG: zinc ribbon domain-containing protein [Pyrinomonadaceae bacterium]